MEGKITYSNYKETPCNTFNNCQRKPNTYIIENKYGNKREVNMCRFCKDRTSEYLKSDEFIYLKKLDKN